MRVRVLPVSVVTVACLLGTAGPSAAACDPDGGVRFLCGPVSPEDLAAVPQSPWVIVSGMENDGYLYLADTRDYTSTVLFPTETSRPRHDTVTYGSCPPRAHGPGDLPLRLQRPPDSGDCRDSGRGGEMGRRGWRQRPDCPFPGTLTHTDTVGWR